MNSAKNKSVTTQTRLTQSNFMNNSLLNNKSSNSTTHQMNQNLQNCENKEIDFLKIKNSQLQERVIRMSHQIQELEKTKLALLGLNQKYIKVVNEYYRRQNHSKDRDRIDSKKENQSSCVNQHRSSHELLFGLEKDHRNLVKHCLVMQQEIKNYIVEMGKFNILKEQLLSVNHTSAKELIEQLEASTSENRQLKKENNRLTYDLEKSQLECRKLRKNKEDLNGKANQNGDELSKYKSLVNTIQQESKDKSNAYQSKIYELEIKVEKLQKELRRDQDWVSKNSELRRKLEIEKVENIHECQKLKFDLVDLLHKSHNKFYSLPKSSKGRLKRENRVNGAFSTYDA